MLDVPIDPNCFSVWSIPSFRRGSTDDDLPNFLISLRPEFPRISPQSHCRVHTIIVQFRSLRISPILFIVIFCADLNNHCSGCLPECRRSELVRNRRTRTCRRSSRWKIFRTPTDPPAATVSQSWLANWGCTPLAGIDWSTASEASWSGSSSPRTTGLEHNQLVRTFKFEHYLHF